MDRGDGFTAEDAEDAETRGEERRVQQSPKPRNSTQFISPERGLAFQKAFEMGIVRGKEGFDGVIEGEAIRRDNRQEGTQQRPD